MSFTELATLVNETNLGQAEKWVNTSEMAGRLKKEPWNGAVRFGITCAFNDHQSPPTAHNLLRVGLRSKKTQVKVHCSSNCLKVMPKPQPVCSVPSLAPFTNQHGWLLKRLHDKMLIAR